MRNHTVKFTFPHILAVCALLGVTMPLESAQAFEPYRDSIGEVAQLASEESTPFVVQGKNIAGTPFEKKYAASIAKFPSVLNCVKAKDKDKPDLSEIDWSKISNIQEAEICFFRLATSYKSPEDMHRWMINQGFKTRDVFTLPSGKLAIRAFWSIKEKGRKFEGISLESWWTSITAYGISVGIDYDPDSSVVDTGVSYIIN